MRISFDPAKARRNAAVHDGVTFDEAAMVFLDPHVLTREDDDAKDEQRFVSLGTGANGRILVVVWTLRDNNEEIRLISAWKASRMQRKRYEIQFT
jgi:uncharacterized DUF497 family protein